MANRSCGARTYRSREPCERFGRRGATETARRSAIIATVATAAAGFESVKWVYSETLADTKQTIE
jgi:hypothetical protein